MQSAVAEVATAETRPSARRPYDYRDTFPAEAYSLTLLGARDVDLAAHFDVDERTIARWKNDHPDFGEQIRAGKSAADARIAHRLFSRAEGFEFTEQQAFKIKCGDGVEKVEVVEVKRVVPPDTTACIFWLKNRRPKDWRDRVEHTGADGTPLMPELSDLDLARRIAELLVRPSLAGPVIDQPTEPTQESTDGPGRP